MFRWFSYYVISHLDQYSTLGRYCHHGNDLLRLAWNRSSWKMDRMINLAVAKWHHHKETVYKNKHKCLMWRKEQSSNQRISEVLHVAKIISSQRDKWFWSICMFPAHVEDSYSYQWRTGTCCLNTTSATWRQWLKMVQKLPPLGGWYT